MLLAGEDADRVGAAHPHAAAGGERDLVRLGHAQEGVPQPGEHPRARLEDDLRPLRERVGVDAQDGVGHPGRGIGAIAHGHALPASGADLTDTPATSVRRRRRRARQSGESRPGAAGATPG